MHLHLSFFPTEGMQWKDLNKISLPSAAAWGTSSVAVNPVAWEKEELQSVWWASFFKMYLLFIYMYICIHIHGHTNYVYNSVFPLFFLQSSRVCLWTNMLDSCGRCLCLGKMPLVRFCNILLCKFQWFYFWDQTSSKCIQITYSFWIFCDLSNIIFLWGFSVRFFLFKCPYYAVLEISYSTFTWIQKTL